jgi:hypothetical protein
MAGSNAPQTVNKADPDSSQLNNRPATLQRIVYGAPGTSVPDRVDIPITMMGQMRALFDLIKSAPDFTQVTMDLGDGSPVHVLDTKTGDKFLPGKLALGLSYILIDMKAKGDPAYPDYLATYQKVTTAMMAQTGATYTYANTSWGEYYYLLALNNLNAKGMLHEVFSDAMLATLQQRLTFCDMFGPDASGNTNTCPAAGTSIDVTTLNTAQNYYAVSYGIAGLRQKLGWSSPTFSSPKDPAVATMGARDALLYTLTNHIRNDSSGGFSDEASNKATTYYDRARFDRYSTLLIGEVTERTIEMDNLANLTDELKGYLRKSVDLILPQLNVNGQGFNYGRSIGPYGDSAFMEVLTAAAKAGVLTHREEQIAYAFIYKAALRYSNFWYDPTLPTPSVNMWVKGRGTDSYRGKPRVMGENFSLLHQYMYVNNRWNELGFKDQVPLPDAAVQEWLDNTRPHYTLTWYNQPGDAAHPYSAALITVRDGKRVINLDMSQAPDYNSFTPYYPVPFADNLIYGTTDQSYALLVPQVSYGGVNYLPVTYYTNLAVQESNGQVVVSFDTTKFRKAAKNAPYTTDLDLQVHTVLTFGHGAMTRVDTLSTGTLTGNIAVETDFTSFAKFQDTTANADGASVTYANSDATGYGTTGFDTCSLSNFDTNASGATNVLSTTPIGQLHSNFACKTSPFTLTGGASRTLSWTLKYNDLP